MLCRCSLVLLAFSLAFAQEAHFDVNAMLKLARIGEPQLSPDGKLIVFTVQRVDLDGNTKPSQIYIVPVDAGAPPHPITTEGTVNERPRWSPDSTRIAFVSNRSGSSQIWTMNAGGEIPKQVTSLSTEASGVVYSPDGKKLVFTSDVFPDCSDDACNAKRVDAEKKNKVKARTYTDLLYRHWTNWASQQRSHLFSISVDGGPPTDLTPGTRDVPPFSLGGSDDYAISPDGKEVCYSMNADAMPATSTNSDLYTVPIGGGESKKITANPGADSNPQYSPDGKYIGYRAQMRGGYESDRWRLMVYERATTQSRDLSPTLDRWVAGFTWSPDSTRLFYTMPDRGRQGVQMISVQGGPSHSIVYGGSSIDDVQFTPDGTTMIYTAQSGSSPAEIYRAASAGGAPVALTHLNDDLLAPYALPSIENFWVEGAGKTRVQSFVVKPPGFQADHKYPVLFLIHGGPQGAWGEEWSYRWNPQVFAAAGYVVVMPNPRGSVGYGQKFTDDINLDWGGKPYDDIMAVVDHVAALPYVDADRMGAAGGSYGGYMVDWLLGHTQRFKVLVSHAGVYDLRSMFGETEELWFPLWEMGGTPWKNADLYTKWSPSTYAANFKTPTLVVDGELDFRVPYGQGLQLFTALQMQKVPSKLLIFPDEGHWVLKPQNAVLWYTTFLDWVGQYLNKPSAPATTK